MPISAHDARRLMQDPALSTIIENMRQQQLDVFAHSRKDEVEKREEAHAMLRCMDLFLAHLNAPIGEEAMQEKRKQRRQTGRT